MVVPGGGHSTDQGLQGRDSLWRSFQNLLLPMARVQEVELAQQDTCLEAHSEQEFCGVFLLVSSGETFKTWPVPFSLLIPALLGICPQDTLVSSMLKVCGAGNPCSAVVYGPGEGRTSFVALRWALFVMLSLPEFQGPQRLLGAQLLSQWSSATGLSCAPGTIWQCWETSFGYHG